MLETGDFVDIRFQDVPRHVKPAGTYWAEAASAAIFGGGADAGVWAYHADRDRQLLEPGDVEEGLRAAAAIGDDRLQQSAGRAVNPDSFTHGTSKQRVQWFKRGMSTGDVASCDTFGS